MNERHGKVFKRKNLYVVINSLVRKRRDDGKIDFVASIDI